MNRVAASKTPVTAPIYTKKDNISSLSKKKEKLDVISELFQEITWCHCPVHEPLSRKGVHAHMNQTTVKL